jgi:hypothetical protein
MDTGRRFRMSFQAATETTVLFHLCLEHDPGCDGQTVTTIDPQDVAERHLAWMRFEGVRACLFGPPNNEALHGHPLWVLRAGLMASGVLSVKVGRGS